MKCQYDMMVWGMPESNTCFDDVNFVIVEPKFLCFDFDSGFNIQLKSCK